MDRLDLGLFDRTMTNTTILVIGSTGKTGKRARNGGDRCVVAAVVVVP